MEYAEPTKLRAYFFTNMYLSAIQQGIQATHVVTKMVARYPTQQSGEAFFIFHAWADVGVTTILLNGGYQSNIADVFTIFEKIAPYFDLPFAKFYEEGDALNGCLTSTGIVVPAEIYDMVPPETYMNPLGGIFMNVKTPQDVLGILDGVKWHLSDLPEFREMLSVLLFITLKSARLAS